MAHKLQDAELFNFWWAEVQKQPRAAQKVKHKLGDSWNLHLDHLQAGTWEAVVGLAGVAAPDNACVALPDNIRPWTLHSLLPVLDALDKAGTELKYECCREWTLKEEDLKMERLTHLLKLCKPTKVILNLRYSCPTLQPLMACLAQASCSVNLLLEDEFEGSDDIPMSDPSLLPLLKRHTRARLSTLSCYLSEKAATHFCQKRKQRVGADEDVVGGVTLPVIVMVPAVGYLQVLKVRLSNLAVVEALNKCLPLMTLLEELEVHLTISRLLESENIPALAYCKDGLTIRLAGMTDARAEWAGRVAAAFSRQYDYIWLTWCRMTAEGGETFLRQLNYSQILVKGVYVFSLSGRPTGKQILSLSVLADRLPAHTTLHW